MQSRRHQEYRELSPSGRRAPGRRIKTGVDRDPQVVARREAVHRSPSHLRNLSPRLRGGSPERSNRYWNLDTIRGERHHSGSTPIREKRKRSQNDVDSGSGDVEFRPPSEVSDADGGSRGMHVRGYDHADAPYGVMNNGRDLNASRITPFRGKSMAVEEGETPEPYCEICANGQSLSHEMDMTHRVDDRHRSRYHPSGSSLGESYNERGSIIYAREGSLAAHHTVRAREFSAYSPQNGSARELSRYSPHNGSSREISRHSPGSAREFSRYSPHNGSAREISRHSPHNGSAREFSRYSPHNSSSRPPDGNLKREILASYGDDEIFSSPSEHTYGMRSSELVNTGPYHKGLPVDAGRNYAKRHNHLLHHSQRQQNAYPVHGDDHEELRYIKQQKIAHGNDGPRGYPSKNLDEINRPHAQLHYHRSQTNDHIGDESAPCCRRATPDGKSVIEDYGYPSHSTTWKQTPLRTRTVQSSWEESDAPQHHGKLLEPTYIHSDYARRPPQNRMAQHFGSRNDYVSRSNPDYGFATDADSRNLHESHHSEEISAYGRKARGIAARLQRVEEEDGVYFPAKHMHNGDYGVEEDSLEENRDHKRINKRNIVQYEDIVDSEGIMDEEDVNDLYGSGSHNDETGMVEMSFHREVHRRGFASNERKSIKSRLEYLPEHPIRYGKYRGRGINIHPGSGPVKGYKSNHHIGQNTGFYNNQVIGKRNDGYFEDNLEHEHDPSMDEEIPEEPELSEDSDEFKQLANEAFLKYSKRININSAVQRRYRAQGNAGSLFCIVCSRRFSKEFRTTENLVKHAFMAQRAQLRANHLGLQRAICVLLGWDTYIPEDMPTISPRVLPKEEALALKEDLILWPPVIVIHNISMSIDHPGEQKVIPIESVKAFLRGKGYAEGKMVICLGKPADQSVMVVKFLGTFSGFGNALKLHQFFAENNRGRVEFQKITSTGGGGKSTGGSSSGALGEDEADHILYGYMGIAEDLDSVDFKTKKVCDIKSKKEIQDFSNDPLKN